MIFVDHQPLRRITSGRVRAMNNYTDGAPVEEKLPKYAVAAICSPIQDGGLSVIAIGAFRRSVRVTSFSRRYEISAISLLQAPVPLAAIMERLTPQIKAHVAPALTAKRALPDGTSTACKEALTYLAPDAEELIERAAGSPRSVEDLSPARRNLLAEEKDALGLVAELAGIGRDPSSAGRALMVRPTKLAPTAPTSRPRS